MILLAIDPGSTDSALVWFDTDTQRVADKHKGDNHGCLDLIGQSQVDHLVVELAESFGAKVWAQVFTTTVWVGRFIERWVLTRENYATDTHSTMGRREVKLHLTGSTRAKDSQIRNCLLERWGGRDKAVGTKLQPGPLCGLKADMWQALAVAVTYGDRVQSMLIGDGEAAHERARKRASRLNDRSR